MEYHNHNEYFKNEFLKGEIQKKENFLKIAQYFSLLSDSTRLKIFWLLCHSKSCIVDIADELDMTTPAVSHHIKLLKDSDLIEGYRDGKEVFYGVVSGEKVEILHSMIEKLMEISCPDFTVEHESINENSQFLDNQVETIKKVHDYLLAKLSERITIEQLAKEFAMNSTTLKTVFKDVYGTSIAAHIKEHRMEKAAKLLVETDLNISQVAQKVGYESQSKFSAVFKEFYNLTPVEYKKNKR